MVNEDIILYKELLGFCRDIKEKQKFKFDGNLEFNEFNEKCFTEMYLKIRNSDNPPKPSVFKEKIPGLKEVYGKAAKFYANKRNEMVKGYDIQYGHWFEKAFMDFLLSKGIGTIKKGFPYPDIEVVKDGKTVAYFEMKYIRAPFIYANKFVDKNRWDYECSLTLDVGEKLTKQREKIESEILPKGVPVYYVWWYDAPHIKGIFFMASNEVFSYWDMVGASSHSRKEREGDLEAKQEKGKIYPPLLKMGSLSDFLNELMRLTK
ncbi:MAG: hypothetical protein U0R44_01645 [Candidatus Micrarchaeia archaeon]